MIKHISIIDHFHGKFIQSVFVYRLINHNDHFNMENNKLVANQYGSNSYRGSYDYTNNVGSYGGFKQNYGNVFGTPESTITNVPEFGVNYSPVYGPNNWPIKNTHIIDQHKLTTNPQTPITNIATPINMTSEHQSQSPQKKIVIPIPNDILIDWRIIGIISLVKLVLVKLKLFSVIKILLFLMLKLKFIIVICAFKFILLLKFMKFFKVLLPLFLLPMFLTMILSPLFFIAIFSIPGRIVQMLRMPMNTPASPVTIPEPVSPPPPLPPSQPIIPAPSNPAPSLPARPSGMTQLLMTNRQSTLTPS